MHQQHTEFIKELKTKFNDKQLLLTLSFLTLKNVFFHGFDYTGIASYANFLHFQLARESHASYENELITRNIHDLEYVIGKIIKLGVPSTKIVMEIAFGGYEIEYSNKSSILRSTFPI